MNLRSLMVLLLLGVPALASPQPRAKVSGAIAVEIGSSASRHGGLLDMLLATPDDLALAVERELVSSLDDRPWVRVVRESGEAAIAISRCQRTTYSRNQSKDGKQTTISFRYIVAAGIAIRGERASLEADKLVSHKYAPSADRQYPTRGEDREAFEKVGTELAKKAREWLLPRIATLRPDGPDAGFRHRARFKLLLKGDGLEVTSVMAGSAAARADLRVGDRVRRIDGEDGTVQMDERVWTFRLEPAGTRVVLEVERDRQRSTHVLDLEVPARSRGDGRL